MLEFDALPLVGVGPVNFGMSRREVRRVLADLGQRKALKRGPNTDCFFKNAFQVHYSSDDAVEFIETASESLFRVLFHGQCLHELIADEAVKFVSKFGEYDRTTANSGTATSFRRCKFLCGAQCCLKGLMTRWAGTLRRLVSGRLDTSTRRRNYIRYGKICRCMAVRCSFEKRASLSCEESA